MEAKCLPTLRSFLSCFFPIDWSERHKVAGIRNFKYGSIPGWLFLDQGSEVFLPKISFPERSLSWRGRTKRCSREHSDHPIAHVPSQRDGVFPSLGQDGGVFMRLDQMFPE